MRIASMLLITMSRDLQHEKYGRIDTTASGSAKHAVWCRQIEIWPARTQWNLLEKTDDQIE